MGLPTGRRHAPAQRQSLTRTLYARPQCHASPLTLAIRCSNATSNNAPSVESLRAFAADDPDLRLRQLAGINIAAAIGPTPPALMAANMVEFKAALPAGVDAPSEVLAIRAYVGGITGEAAANVESLCVRAMSSIDQNDPMLSLWPEGRSPLQWMWRRWRRHGDGCPLL